LAYPAINAKHYVAESTFSFWGETSAKRKVGHFKAKKTLARSVDACQYPPMKEAVNINVRISKRLLAAADELAEKYEANRSTIVRLALKRMIMEEDRKGTHA